MKSWRGWAAGEGAPGGAGDFAAGGLNGNDAVHLVHHHVTHGRAERRLGQAGPECGKCGLEVALSDGRAGAGNDTPRGRIRALLVAFP